MPMTEDDFNIWCRQLDFPDYTRQLIKQIRSSPPSRTVQGRFSNVCGTYSSFKMGVTIQFESHRGELAHIIDKLEHGLDVLEYYDQPPPIELIYLSKNGNLVRCSHTPDFFVIKHNWAGWEEFKTEDELIKQAQEKPNRYLLDEEGRWLCPPGEEYAQRYGLGYRLRSSEEINPIRLRNWIWLEPYFQAKGLSENFEINQEILSKVKAEPGITYAEILLEVEGIDPDDINILIVTERVYVNLDAAPLAEPHQVRVFLNQEIAKAYSRIALTSSSSSPVGGFYTLKVDVGTSFSWDGEYWEITNPGHESVHFKRADGKTTSLRNEEFYALFERGEITGLETQTESSSRPDVLKILLRARPEDIKVANQRYEAIEPYLQDNPPAITKANRSIRRWRDSYRETQKLYGEGNGYIGLIPRHIDKGHNEKLEPALVEFMDEFIENNYFTPKNRRAGAVYRDFKEACKNHESRFVPPSEKRFRLQIKRLSSYQLTKSRQGSRIAKLQKPFHSTSGMPRNGELPWESAHIDHTLIDIELVSSLISLATCNTSSAIELSDIELGRCWATFMVDSCIKRILAVYLSFEEPSYRSCMMVIRICVQRFKRLPQTIITDNGAEFHSIYFKQLLAYYKCTHKYRPPGEPRYGHPVERVFGSTNSLWIHELKANTQILQRHRQVTKSVHPKGQAVWTIGKLYQATEHWAYEIYDKREHSSLGQSPRGAYETGIALGGRREMRRIDYDETFLLLTLPSPRHGEKRVVQPGRGVKIYIIYYWCDAFRDPEVEGQSVYVKEEPFNVSIAHAYVKGRWHKCISDHHQFLEGRTEKELLAISADLRKRKSGHAKRVEISDTELVFHLRSAEAMEGELLKQRLQALENLTVLNLIEGKQTLQNYGNVHHTESLAQYRSTQSKVPVDELTPDFGSDSDDLAFYGEF